MAFSGQDPVLAKRRFFHAIVNRADAYNIAVAFFSWLNQQGGKPDCQVVELDNGTATAQVICAGACSLLALVMYKPTVTAGYAKFSDHATDYSAAAEVARIGQNVVGSALLLYPKGLSLATGLTYESHTTPNGTTTSAAGDGATGVALIKAA